MKKTRKLLSLILSVLMIATAFSVTTITSAVPSSSSVIYVMTGGTGTGASPASPVGNISSAMQNIMNSGGGTVVLVGPTEITANIDFGKGGNYSTNILFTSVYDGVDYRQTAGAALIFASSWKNIEVQSPVEFQNIDIVTKGDNCSIYANGYPVILGEGVNCYVGEGLDENKATNYLGVYGGSACDLSGTKNFPANTSVTVLSGTYYSVRAGGKGNAEKPRPSASGTITLSAKAKIMDKVLFDFNENGVIEGEKILINVGSQNEKAAAIASEATRTHTVSGNGYVRGIEPGKVYVQADFGYAAKVDGEFIKNGEYENNAKNITFAFEASELNKEDDILTGNVTVVATPSNGATSTSVIYVAKDGTGTGYSPDAPSGNLTSAIRSMVSAGGGTVVLVGPTEITSNIDFGGGGDYSSNIVFTSVYNDVDYRKTAGAALMFASAWKNIEVQSPIEFQNIDIVTMGDNCSIYANGYPVILGEGINCYLGEGLDENKAANYLGVYGGSACDLSGTKNYPANTSLTVLSGTYYSVRAGGKGNAEKPRPSSSGTITLSAKAKIMDKVLFDFNENGVIQGEKILINVDDQNEKAADIAGEATRTYEVSGNGFVRGVEPGKVNIRANTGFAAKVDGEFIKNGDYTNDAKNITFTFEESDLNKAEDLAVRRPTLPSAFPGEYIKGYDNGDGTMSFRPSGNITIAEATTILVRLLTTEEAIKGKNTTDKAKDTDWFYDNIAYLDSFESFDTFDNFDGNRQITRAEFLKLITMFKKFAAKTDEIKFTDVTEDHKYYDAIKTGTTSKIVNGYDNGDGTFAFRPDAPITRAEVVTVINRVFDMADLAPIKYKDLEPNFSDVDLTHWAAYQIIAAAGGREIDNSDAIHGTGEVEYQPFGQVVFMMDTEKGDGSGKDFENAASYSKGHKMITETGTFVVCGPITINSNIDFSLGNTGKVLFTSVYDGVDYRETNDAAFIFGSNWRNAVPRSEAVFDNIAFISRGNNCSIYCDNQKVTFGKDVVCVVENGSAISVYAGSANDLSSCQNYIGSTSTHVSHNGNYFGNLTINGGMWANVTGTGNGSAAKPRESNGSAVAISGTANIGSVTVGLKENEGRSIHGLRALIFNNVTKIVNEDEYDILVNVTGAAEAQIVEVKQDSITIRVVADNGSKVEGVNEDGTLTLTEACGVSVKEQDGKVTVTKVGKDGIEAADDQNAETATDEYLAELDALEAKRIAEIKSTKTEVAAKEGRTSYYVSFSTGDDANDGKSPEKAVKTVEKANTLALSSGDAVFFKRGDEWRGTTLKTKPGVTYSAYGEGDKPILNMSPFDGAKTGTWTAVEGYPNIYVYSETIKNDVGSISFNNRTFIDIYAQKMCFDYIDGKPYTRDNKTTPVEDILAFMKNDLDFWHDCGGPNIEAPTGKGQIYLRSDKGNPAERFTNIEFNPRIHGITAANNVTIDNFTILQAGAHGVSAGTVNNLKVQNCVFEWIGGGMQSYSKQSDGSYSFVRFGNAVEVYGGCDGYTVDNCYITQVYDAGVTHQISDSTEGDFIMKNVTYSNNVITRCVYSIEHFNRMSKNPSTRYLVNILYTDNLCRFAGACFGMTRPDKTVIAHIRSGTLVDTANFVIQNNIFDRSEVSMFRLQGGGDTEIQWKNNVYIHKLGASYGTMSGVSKIYNSQIPFEISVNFKYPEINGRYLFIKE